MIGYERPPTLNFAGAVRAIAERVTSLSWEQLCFLLHSHGWPDDA